MHVHIMQTPKIARSRSALVEMVGCSCLCLAPWQSHNDTMTRDALGVRRIAEYRRVGVALVVPASVRGRIETTTQCLNDMTTQRLRAGVCLLRSRDTTVAY